MSDGTGWFVNTGRDDDPMPGMFQPCLETDTGWTPSFDVWFEKREDCETFIRNVILPVAGKMSDA